VTRGRPGAGRTAARLEQRGFEAVVAPLLAIRPLPPFEPDLDGVAALAFTSPNGVAAFAGLTSRRDLPVFAVGDATAAAARAAGWGETDSAGGAIGDLARLLADRAPGPVLAPGAREPAGDLPGLLRGKVEVRRLPVYEAVETGAAAPAGWDAVLVHSPRAGRALAAALGPGGGRGRLAAAISEAAAAPLEGCAFAALRVAAAPAEAALLEALGNPGGDV
jgi:uroporphyrinogen-III synthase